jgi:excisionase family DNA binding protein
MSKLVTAKEVGEALGLGVATVLTLARDGRIPAIRLNDRVIRFDLDVVMRKVAESVKDQPATAA